MYCRIYEEDPEESMQLCQALLDEPNVDTALRLGDVYGLMIEHYGQTSDYKQVRETSRKLNVYNRISVLGVLWMIR